MGAVLYGSSQALKNVGEIVEYVKSILSSIETLDKETKDALKLIVDGHSIVQMLNALSRKKASAIKAPIFILQGRAAREKRLKLISHPLSESIKTV